MTSDSAQLKQIVDQRPHDPAVAGRFACSLKNDLLVEQSHCDGRQFEVLWQDRGGFRRCTFAVAGSTDYIARLELHDHGTIRLETREPCSVTISPDDDLLCLTRYRL